VPRDTGELLEVERLAPTVSGNVGRAQQTRDAIAIVAVEREQRVDSVLRRWPNAARTISNRRSASGTSTGGAVRKRTRSSVESTSGRGQNADGGTWNSGSSRRE
jgi:hypothetical protein